MTTRAVKQERVATAAVCLAVVVFTLGWLWMYSEYEQARTLADSGLPPCATEDSDNCYWDADTMGNGLGRSFTVVDGQVYYEDAR